MPVRFFQHRICRSVSLTWAAVAKDKHHHLVLYSGRNRLALEGIQADNCSMWKSSRRGLCEYVLTGYFSAHACFVARFFFFLILEGFFGFYARVEMLYVFLHRNWC